MLLWDICKYWIVQNENLGRYFLLNNLFCTIVLNLPLKLHSKLFCLTKATNVYVLMFVYNIISTSSVMAYTIFFN
jgi:hypothetical protein